MASSFDQVKQDYDANAAQYADYHTSPLGTLEKQLICTALGDCTGSTVLDLGGGAGFHARHALDAGATAVDVVDLSPEMLRRGQAIEDARGRRGTATTATTS
ncbi:hypothetical protein F5Y15DRAFT_418801 [Xylariaceae sp. FL0016]|nr:hypothetical protein F5Y15DRAFT_418801 [Xylariaceae sp. FL0016]